MTTFKGNYPVGKIVPKDDYNTPLCAWKDMLQFINKREKLWLPFYNDGSCKELVKNLGYNIIHFNKDFYTYDISDALIIDNPPYNKKEKILEKLLKDTPNRRISLLLPIGTLERKYLRKYNTNLQVVIPNKYYSFIESGKPAPFMTCWFCWNLQKELGTTEKLIWI